MLAQVADVIGERQLDQEEQHRQQDQVDDQRRIKMPARQVRRDGAQPRRQAREEQQRRQRQPQRLLDRPDDVAAAVVAEGLLRRGRNGDRSFRRFGWLFHFRQS